LDRLIARLNMPEDHSTDVRTLVRLIGTEPWGTFGGWPSESVAPCQSGGYLDILKLVTKVLVSMDDKLLARVDRAARRLGLSRSAYLTRLAAKDLGDAHGPGRDPKVREALAALDRLFAENPTPGDVTAIIRKMRDSR